MKNLFCRGRQKRFLLWLLRTKKIRFDSAVKMIAKSNDRHLMPKRWAKKYRMEWKNRMSLPKKDVP